MVTALDNSFWGFARSQLNEQYRELNGKDYTGIIGPSSSNITVVREGPFEGMLTFREPYSGEPDARYSPVHWPGDLMVPGFDEIYSSQVWSILGSLDSNPLLDGYTAPVWDGVADPYVESFSGIEYPLEHLREHHDHWLEKRIDDAARPLGRVVSAVMDFKEL